MRIASRLLIGAGLLLLVWALVVWRWQDPFTGLYTHWQQQKLGHALDREFAAYQPSAAARGLALAAKRDAVAAEAARFRRSTHAGEAIGRIVIHRLGLNMVLVDGTNESALQQGPGRDLR